MTTNWFERPFEELQHADLDRLKEQGEAESMFFEFKQQNPGARDVAKASASFANSHGGYLLIGVRAEGTENKITDIPGVTRMEGLSDRISDSIVGNLDPVPMFRTKLIPHDTQKDSVTVVVHIPESPNPPHIMTSTGIIYVRHPASADPIDRIKNRYELEELYRKKALTGDLSDVRARERLESKVSPEQEPPFGSMGVGTPWAMQVVLVPIVSGEDLIKDVFTSQFAGQFAIWATLSGTTEVRQDQDSIWNDDSGRGTAITRSGVIHGWVFGESEDEIIPGHADVLVRLLKTCEIARHTYASVEFHGLIQFRLRMYMWSAKRLAWGDWRQIPEASKQVVATGKDLIDISRRIRADDLQDSPPAVIVGVMKELLRAFGVRLYD